MNYNMLKEDVLICNADTFEKIKHHAHLLTLFLRETSFLTEAYILDYFVEELWTRLPSGWFEVVKNFDTDDLENFINHEKSVKCCQPWPLSLLSFRASAFALSISRKSIKSLENIQKFLLDNFTLKNMNPDSNSSNVNSAEFSDWGFSSNEFGDKSGQHKSIPEFCRRHVKPKKQHEIFRMAELSNYVLNYFGLQHVIDIGSGQGHLSRLLALCHNFKVATIEANQFHVSGAINFDKQAYNTLERLKSQTECTQFGLSSADVDSKTLPHHLESSVTLSSSVSCLEKVIKDAWCQSFDSNVEKFALMGLHACGSLSETILKTFVKYDHSQVLLSIGCCYMKLDSNIENEGYPLSQFVKSLNFHSLSYEAKEMACHALEMYVRRLHENLPTLKIHCYRATLEKCIIHHFPNLKHLGLRGVKHAELLEFSDYAEKALSKVNLSIPKQFFLSPDIQLCLQRWKEVLIFYSLRLITAPIVESLILMDRLLYLYEEGYCGCIAPIFDPYLSPRNQILIAAKCNGIY